MIGVREPEAVELLDTLAQVGDEPGFVVHGESAIALGDELVDKRALELCLGLVCRGIDGRRGRLGAHRRLRALKEDGVCHGARRAPIKFARLHCHHLVPTVF